MEIRVIAKPVSKAEIAAIAEKQFGNLVKAVVDIELGIMAIGGELHADEEAVLLQDCSKQSDLWGINLYPGKSGEEWIELDSMINVRPSQNNMSRGVEDPARRERIISAVQKLELSRFNLHNFMADT